MSKSMRMLGLVALVVATAWAPPSSADLLVHHGFETCWVPGQTKAQFLEAIRTSIHGSSACVPSQSGSQSGFTYTVCATPNGCGSGVEGCPVSVSAGAFTGDFQAGQFSGPGAVANIQIPIVIAGIGSCSVNLNNSVLGFTLDYLMLVDGTDGVYSDGLMAPTVVISGYQLVNNNCPAPVFSLISSNIGTAIAAAEDSASSAIDPGLRANTLYQAVCPISAP